MMYMTSRRFPFCFQMFYLWLHQGKYARRKYDQWKVRGSHGEGGSESSMGISLQGRQPRRSSSALDVYLDMTHPSSLQSGSFDPCQNTCRESKYMLNSSWMQNKIKTSPLNWAWPGITRADQSPYSSKVKSSPARSIRSHRCDCHSRKALRLEADNHLGRLSG